MSHFILSFVIAILFCHSFASKLWYFVLSSETMSLLGSTSPRGDLCRTVLTTSHHCENWLFRKLNTIYWLNCHFLYALWLLQRTPIDEQDMTSFSKSCTGSSSWYVTRYYLFARHRNQTLVLQTPLQALWKLLVSHLLPSSFLTPRPIYTIVCTLKFFIAWVLDLRFHQTLWEINLVQASCFYLLICLKKSSSYGTVTPVDLLDLACEEGPEELKMTKIYFIANRYVHLKQKNNNNKN